MAKRYWGANQGQTEFQVLESSATNSTQLELVLDLAGGLSKNDVLILIEEIKNTIVKDIWPPA